MRGRSVQIINEVNEVKFVKVTQGYNEESPGSLLGSQAQNLGR